MSFEIPPGKERFFSDTKQKIDLLIRKNIFNGIKQYELQAWLNNFSDDRALYLAAHLLDSLIYRSPDMLRSMRRHMLETQLVKMLLDTSYTPPKTLKEFLSILKVGGVRLPLRFVAMDGSFEKTPGKSGGSLIRDFRQDGIINKNITVRPEDVNKLPSHVKWLVFLDDFVGTGKQTEKFVDYYEVSKWAKSRVIILLSFMAHSVGVEKIKTDFPFINFNASESLTKSNGFFSVLSGSHDCWSRDRYNSVGDALDFYLDLLHSKGVENSRADYALDLTIAFSRTIPNNTLAAYWTSKGEWQPLINRG